MKRLVEEIKQIINEFHGVQFDIKTLSQQLAEEVISRINLELEKINDGNIWDLISQIRLNSGYSKKLGIGLITTKIEYQNSNKKPYGAYKTNELKIQDDGTYSVVISLNVFKELNKDNIVSIISHELNHAYVDIKSINGDRKSAKYNKANKKMKVDLKHLSNEFSEVKEFINMSYLSNSLEVQARVQEVFVQIEKSKEKSPEELIKYLLRFQPLSDAKKMISYKVDGILKLDEKVLHTIVDSFNENFDLENKKFKTTGSFFSYWQKTINNSGETLIKKIYKLVSDKYTIKESEFYFYDSFNWIFGKSFDDWFINS